MTTTYRRASGAVDAIVDGQVILLSPRDFSYHALDRVGARIWALLADPMSADALIEKLATEYPVDPSQCRADVEPFLARMTDIAVLERGEP